MLGMPYWAYKVIYFVTTNYHKVSLNDKPKVITRTKGAAKCSRAQGSRMG